MRGDKLCRITWLHIFLVYLIYTRVLSLMIYQKLNYIFALATNYDYLIMTVLFIMTTVQSVCPIMTALFFYLIVPVFP